jgi:hypothetical protein
LTGKDRLLMIKKIKGVWRNYLEMEDELLM